MSSIDTNFKRVDEVPDGAVELITGDGHIGLTSCAFRDVTKLLKTLADTEATLLINPRRSGDQFEIGIVAGSPYYWNPDEGEITVHNIRLSSWHTHEKRLEWS